jgi:hypothetical protein
VVNSHAVSGIYSTTTTKAAATASDSNDNIHPERHNQENSQSQPQCIRKYTNKVFLKKTSVTVYSEKSLKISENK